MIVLDTSSLIRFFTNDDQVKAQKVKSLLESDQELLLIDAVLLELIYTLISFYKLPKSDLVKIVEFLLALTNVSISAETRIALKIFLEKNLSISGCLVIAHGLGNQIASFDQNLLKHPSVKPYLF